MKKPQFVQLATVLLVTFCSSVHTSAQRVRLPMTPIATDVNGTTLLSNPTSGTSALAPVPQLGTNPTTATPGATLGAPSFDPYATQPGTSFGGPPAAYPATAPSFGSTTLPPPPQMFGATAPPVYNPSDQSAAFPSSPPVMFPDGQNVWGLGAASGAATWGPPLRLIYGPRFRWTWLPGDSSSDNMEWHDIDVSVAVAFPNFLYSGQPIYILPSFGLDLWSGPAGPLVPFPPGPAPPLVQTHDLPPNAYQAYMDIGWQSDPNRILSTDLGGRVGIFTDFETYSSESWRFIGKALLRYRCSPRVLLKAGVLYADRNKTKMLPAGGILWEPHERARFDIYFPEPKGGFYLTTMGNVDVWWYIAGEWGGGSWTIKRATTGDIDSIDLNDIRLITGIEWGSPDMFRQGRRIGFVEFGWVTNRELLYFDTQPPTPNKVNLDDTLMLRAGIGY